MKQTTIFLTMLAASFGLNADGIHYHTGDNCEVCETQEPNERAWYHRIDYMEHDGHEDPTLKLDEDTSWPGEREEFSDMILRD